MRAGKERAFELDRRPTGQPSKIRRCQAVCGEAECQRRRRADYHRVGNSPSIPNTATAAGTVPENGAFAIRITGSNIGRRTPSPLSETANNSNSGIGSAASAILQTTPQLWT